MVQPPSTSSSISCPALTHELPLHRCRTQSPRLHLPLPVGWAGTRPRSHGCAPPRLCLFSSRDGRTSPPRPGQARAVTERDSLQHEHHGGKANRRPSTSEGSHGEAPPHRVTAAQPSCQPSRARGRDPHSLLQNLLLATPAIFLNVILITS
jgi:hypothetical protein